jgi:hypothetical protein
MSNWQFPNHFQNDNVAHYIRPWLRTQDVTPTLGALTIGAGCGHGKINQDSKSETSSQISK